jgi:large subunit ribosomal protein L17
MRHGRAHRKLGRVADHRVAMLRNQAQDLLRHERIRTTVPRAKELRPFVERIITIAKRSLADAEGRGVTARRLVARDIQDRAVVVKLFDTIAPRFAERPGGYTRLLRLGYRRGDDAEVAQVELLGSEYNPSATSEKGAAETAAAGKTKGVGGRLRAAADRLRGKKAEATEKAEGRGAEPKKSKARGSAKGTRKTSKGDED